ncbi:MAG: transposase [Gloeocapsa sp. UFS-A4-WI-NPMV-4B04]|jgi:hypothetical protein|nr:transposase [Gloeocapsa sp. UFS-A4-WI-NPMV-4B04]
MANKNREKQAAVLNRTQEQRRQEYQQKIFQAVTDLWKQSRPITPTSVARIAGVSLSYIYKWDQIKDYIQSEQQRQSKQEQDKKSTKELLEPEPGPYSLRTLHEVARKRIKELEIEIEELKRQNRLLRGHVAEIYELRDERDRFRQRVLELTKSEPLSKVLPFKHEPVKIQSTDNDLADKINDALCKAGITPTVRLNKEIQQHSAEVVLTAIEAFVQYRNGIVVEKPVACLMSMIRDEAKPNVPEQPVKPEEREFDEWYLKAIQTGFCLDIPKNHLGEIRGEIQVKVTDPTQAGGYLPMRWQEAKALMEAGNRPDVM